MGPATAIDQVRYILTRRQKLRATDPASKGGSFFGELGPKRKEVARDGKMYETVKMVLDGISSFLCNCITYKTCLHKV